MSWPKFSVVVPSFNQAKFLPRTLRSILDQNYPDLELIVIDGGSTDTSVEVIHEFKDHIAYWISERDQGQTHALVKGFARSSGELQCWLNSDDLFEPNALREAALYLKEHPNVDAVFGDSMWIDAEGLVLRPYREIPFNRFIWLHTYNYVPGMSMFWRRAIYERVGGLDCNFHLAMDADLWIRFAEVGKIAHVRRCWSRMRFYPEQKNQRLRALSNAEDERIRARYVGKRTIPRAYFKRPLAQSLRVIWKLATGCYPPGYRRYLDRAKANS